MRAAEVSTPNLRMRKFYGNIPQPLSMDQVHRSVTTGEIAALPDAANALSGDDAAGDDALQPSVVERLSEAR